MSELTFAVLLFAAATIEPPKPCPLPVEQAQVSRVIDGATFELKDGRHAKLAAILPPRTNDPLADQALIHLSDAIAGKTVGLAFDARTTDRHGALIAHVFVDENWVQQSMVTAGLARVRTFADTAQCASPLLAGEAKAREAKRGLWAIPHYRVRKVDELDADIGTFQIVEGKVASVATSRGRVFVNFGADYRTDFTIAISARDARHLIKDGLDPATWAQKQIRVRGWLSRLNGPEVELTHAAQIQIIE